MPCKKSLTVLFIFLSAVFARAQVTIDLKLQVPLLIENEGIYFASDFNDWNSGDPDYKLRKVNDSTYSIYLENAPRYFEYKFTQGSWTTAEGTPAGEPFPNRIYSNDGPEVSCELIGWEQQIEYGITIPYLPENTPEDAKIYIAGNFNKWSPNSDAYLLRKNIDGGYYTRIYTDLEEIEFKFTRGSWESVEARPSGKARPNRKINRATIEDSDNLSFTIEGWEDLNGTFSIYSFYDLLLLFSVFQGILLMIAIPTLQSNNTGANRWLLVTIGLSSFSILCYVLSNYNSTVQAFPKILFLSDFVLFLYGPLYYFYLRQLLFQANSLPSRWYLHFIPFLIQLLVYLPFFLSSDNSMLDSIMNQETTLVIIFLVTGFAGLLWNLYYWNLFRRSIQLYKEQHQTNFSFEQNLNYLSTVLVIQFTCLFLWVVFFLVFGLSNLFKVDGITLQENFIDLIWLAFSAITYFIGYFAIKQAETFKAEPRKISIFDDILETPIAQKVQTLSNEKPTEEPDESILTTINALEKNLEENKPFHNPKLSLSELAQQINVPPHQLSKAINVHYHKNFFELINGLRIDEFKTLAQNPKYQHLTLLALAYEVGFNSKTAFNRSFKKTTGQTPREYFDKAVANQKLKEE
ncbi:helix-turn-helix domain-containing protein [Jiulongibacter sp. NS-SX5]|uniref:helix-turn-helix domain-containing protein n=1 Tax=Jiulongibacter sp. NS-SX5 TaxID=3463854 RepID=UPI0040597907